jgi:DNA-binding response OmpR family regulator
MGVGGKAVILVVDDEPGVLKTLAMVLEQAGYSVLTLDKGREALDMVAGVAIDLALIDVNMPRMDGIAVGREIRKKLPNCKILLITGSAAGSDRIIAARTEGLEFDVVAKPIPPEELLERIYRLLSGDSPSQAA